MAQEDSFVLTRSEVEALGGQPGLYTKILPGLVFTEEDVDAWGFELAEVITAIEDNDTLQGRIGEFIRDEIYEELPEDDDAGCGCGHNCDRSPGDSCPKGN